MCNLSIIERELLNAIKHVDIPKIMISLRKAKPR